MSDNALTNRPPLNWFGELSGQEDAAGVEGIVNFAPVTINRPEHVRHIGVDLAIELEQLSFAVVNRTATDGK